MENSGHGHQTINSETKVADAIKKSWVYRLVPQNLWPFAQLARWERPIGWWLLMWPGWWSIMLANMHIAAISNTPSQEALPPVSILALISGIVYFLFLFMAGAIVMRGAGCTYNDLADRDIDDQVARTRSRPLPSGRVTGKQAIAFLFLQLLVGLIILLQFNAFSIWLGIASLVTVIIYPFMKRVTWWPQLFLGFAFSWGALLGWAVIVDSLAPAPVLLYLAGILWVIGYDTIYAHQDKEDDALVGVKSTARLFGKRTRTAISLLYSTAIILMAIAVSLALPSDQPSYGLILLPAYAGLCAGGVHMLWQLATLDIDNPDQCLKLFQSNSHFGWILFAGFTGSMVLSFVQ
ncbi:MAG: 4-hydroxybenzoate octaprenyltransferase [Hyphomicrobiales bacterium]|nr:4-hydroxybenzoate octaprenyltransferase [Hyphomicrobiales bacterium]